MQCGINVLLKPFLLHGISFNLLIILILKGSYFGKKHLYRNERNLVVVHLPFMKESKVQKGNKVPTSFT